MTQQTRQPGSLQFYDSRPYAISGAGRQDNVDSVPS